MEFAPDTQVNERIARAREAMLAALDEFPQATGLEAAHNAGLMKPWAATIFEGGANGNGHRPEAMTPVTPEP